MSFMTRVKTGPRILAAVALLAIAASYIGWSGVSAISTYENMTNEMTYLSGRAIATRSLDAKVVASTADTRAVYLARNENEMRKAAAELVEEAKEIEQDATAIEAATRPEAKARIIEKVKAPTIRYAENRRELARVGLAHGAEAARTFGDDPAIRQMRESLVESLGSVADDYERRVVAMNGELTVFYEKTVPMLIGVTVGGILLSLGLALVVVIGTVTRPIGKITQVMGDLADGNVRVSIPGLERGDEIGSMAKAVEVFRVNMEKNQEMEAENRRQDELREKRRVTVDNLIADFNGKVSSALSTVAGAVGQMKSQAQGMNGTAETASTQSAAVAAASEQAAANVQTVASAAEELSSSISEISRQVSQSSNIAQQAVSEAEATNRTIRGLAEAAQKIGEVVDLISDIANQTNLLALNATIEAARAGESGKGFAVVAAEVKNLANQTAKATEEITAQVSAIQQETGNAVSAIERIGKIIGETSQISTAIAAAIEEQGAATQEIARNVQQAATGTSEVTANITGVSRAVTDTREVATNVLQASNDLDSQANVLRREVDDFLVQVKAA